MSDKCPKCGKDNCVSVLMCLERQLAAAKAENARLRGEAHARDDAADTAYQHSPRFKHDMAELLTLRTENARLSSEVERLREIVGKLPKTADGVILVPGTEVWCAFRDGVVHGVVKGKTGRACVVYDEPIDLSDGGEIMVEESDPDCRVVYSTRAAAEAAKEKKP